MQSTFIVALVFAVLVAVFAILNGEVVTINLLFQKFQISQALVILIAAILGAISVYMMNLVNKVKTSLKVKDLNKKLKQSEMEIAAMKERIAMFEEEASAAAEEQAVPAVVEPSAPVVEPVVTETPEVEMPAEEVDGVRPE
ncbi:LapA family protein [Acidaminobacter hydrogenoformans]|uniref:Uncharacterized integral membrane protein n=1 Tax=Acidaminobacter hydrogenoformans DSM 2784 TaxID=1120920 RepID=A0A1G5RWE1_9FIRM|nr:LapA family protein [Acidaminobacter hydrogenoformans]SCZ78366.1 Uncharacterized integral membrane protein [Acidaminobacter hydrogenoformans DSM 2784]